MRASALRRHRQRLHRVPPRRRGMHLPAQPNPGDHHHDHHQARPPVRGRQRSRRLGRQPDGRSPALHRHLEGDQRLRPDHQLPGRRRARLRDHPAQRAEPRTGRSVRVHLQRRRQRHAPRHAAVDPGRRHRRARALRRPRRERAQLRLRPQHGEVHRLGDALGVQDRQYGNRYGADKYGLTIHTVELVK